jgi:CHAD domain-containing protein
MKSGEARAGSHDNIIPIPALPVMPAGGLNVRNPGIGDAANLFFSAAVERNLEVLRAMSPRVPDGDDPEVIHDVRVAIRRIRTCLSLRTPGAARKQEISIDEKLRSLFRLLGEVRDYDVLLESAYVYYKRLGVRRAREFVAFVNDCEISRSKALARVIAVFRSPSLAVTLDSAGSVPAMYLDSDGLDTRAVPAELDAAVLVASKYRTLLSFDAILNAGAAPDEAYHAARRAAKRLRYSIEFFMDILGPGAVRCHGTIKTLQDHLGLMNDTFFAIRSIMSFLSHSVESVSSGWSEGDNPTGPELARYLVLRQHESRTLAAGFARVWARMTSPAFRKTLFTALGTMPDKR